MNGSVCVDGEKQPYFEWKRAQWIDGKVVGVEWVRREIVGVNEMRTVLNFTKMASSAAEPSLENQVTSLENEVINCECDHCVGIV